MVIFSGDEGRAIIPLAARAARDGGVLGTPHLVAALLDAEGGLLGEALRARGMPADRLRQALGVPSEGRNGAGAAPGVPEPSRNVLEIINLAEEEAKKTGSRCIGERELLAAVARHGGGAAGSLMALAGFDLAGLARAAVAEGKTFPEGEYSPEARLAIERAAAAARSCGAALVGTPHLFLALLECPPPELDRFLAASGVEPAALADSLRRELGLPPGGEHPAGGGSPAPSPNLEEALRIAWQAAASAGRAQATPADLLRGLAARGGRVARWLAERFGLELAGVFSRFSAADGEFQEELFDPEARRALAEARRRAALTGWREIRTPHLFMGLCSVRGGPAARLLLAQGIDPDKLVESLQALFCAKDPSEKVRTVPDRAAVSERVRRLVQRAELLCAAEGAQAVSQRHLLAALLEEPGETGLILERLGVSLERMGRDLWGSGG